jgi:hypothetical protein
VGPLFGYILFKISYGSQSWWLTSVIPATLEVEMGRIKIYPRQKKKAISINNPGVSIHACDPSYTEGGR